VIEVPFMYSGNVLTVHLDEGRMEESFLPDDLVADRVGGALLGLEFWRRNRDGDPVVLASGPLTGGLVPTASSTVLTARSPLTGGVVHASVTNHAGPEIKYSGYDIIVLRGRAPAPVYLWVHDEQAELLDASDLWGSDPTTVTNTIRDRQGDERVQVLSAGPACVRGSMAASLSVNQWASTDRAAVGALVASKNLLALAVRGMGELEPADIDGFGRAVLGLMSHLRSYRPPEGYAWDDHRLDDAREAISPLVHRTRGCFFCTSRGRPYLMLDQDPSVMERPDVDSPGVMVSDLLPLGDLTAAGLDGRAIGEVTRTAHRLGLDPCRAAAAIRQAAAVDGPSARPVLEALARGEGAPSRGDGQSCWDLGDGTGGHQAFVDLGVFTPANPPLVPTEGAEGAYRLAILQGISYILGMCPAGAVGAGIDAPSIAPVVEVATGLGLTPDDLEGLAHRLVAETLVLNPSPEEGVSPLEMELRRMFS
jgi:aldehyde:ferredoxin oxidoreductase